MTEYERRKDYIPYFISFADEKTSFKKKVVTLISIPVLNNTKSNGLDFGYLHIMEP